MAELMIRQGMSKRAAAEDGPSFEQQFGILTNALVSDKYPKLDRMKLAFQLIHKTEDDGAAVGASVYLIGDNVIFIPAFYRKGKIRTGDIMLVANTQQFLPISDPWLSWLQEKDLQEPGGLVPDDDKNFNNSVAAARLDTLSNPLTKTAGVHLRAMGHITADLFRKTAGTGILDLALGMGKRASEVLLDNFIGRPDFLNAALRFYSGEEINWFAKKAAALGKPDSPAVSVVLPFTKQAKELSPADKALLDRDGFLVIRIQQGDDAVSPVVLKSSRIPATFKTLTSPGVVSLPLMDGDIRECLVMRRKSIYLETTDAGLSRPNRYTSTVESYGAPVSVKAVRQDNADYGDRMCAFLTKESGKPFILSLDTMVVADTASNSRFEPAALQGYGKALDSADLPDLFYGSFILCPDGCAYQSFGSRAYKYDKGWCTTEGFLVVVGKDPMQKSPIMTEGMLLLPKGARLYFEKPRKGSEGIDNVYDEPPFVGADSKGIYPFVTFTAMSAFLGCYTKRNFNKVSIAGDGVNVLVADGAEPVSMTVKEASLHLASKYRIEPDIVRGMLKDMRESQPAHGRKYEDYLISKTASQDPWEPANIGMHEVSSEEGQTSSMPLSNMTGDPETLQRAVVTAAESGIREVFDVTALKVLVRQNRFLDEIQESLPLFMRVLDSLCRKLFLLYWHTEEFEKQYGAVKLKSLEEVLKTTLDSLSEITVFFKLRTADGDTGAGDHGGDLMDGYDM